MQASARFRNYSVHFICLLYILLFTYAALNKILDFEHFRIQVGKSPLLSGFAGFISIAVPASELCIAVLLLLPKMRNFGLWCSLSLMVMFTAYIGIILNFSSYIPCSCGGILEKLGWKEHLIFNIGFVLIAALALWFQRAGTVLTVTGFFMRLTVVFVVGSGVMALLYIFSEHEIHRNNGFVRRYPHHPVELVRGYDLTYNSYYIAGFADGNVYLGNVTSPLDVVEIDTLLNNRKSFRIRLKGNADYPFSAVQIRIAPPYFFLSDGTVPIIYRGSMRDWVAHKYADGATRFSQWEVVDSTNIVVRSIDEDGNVVGLVGKDGKFKKGIGLLEKQVDGIFDTDGTLNYNESLKAIAYTYYYRNGFVTADTNFGNVYRGRTIDTVSRQHIKIVYEDSSRLQSMAKQPTQIQKFSYSSGRYLFTISDRLGKYEEEELLKDAVIVDVYDIINHTYEFSFYLYNYKNDRVRSFRVYNNLIVAMTQRHLVIYKMKQKEFDFSMSE